VFKFILFILAIFISSIVIAQGELNTETRVVTTNEHSFLLAANSNGAMFSFQYGKRLDGFRKRTFDIDFAYIKHPKEVKSQNVYYQNQKKFVFGKLNSMFTFRVGLGKQREIFSIYDKGGIAIRYHYELGANIAILKPIYYEVVDSSKIVDNIEYLYISQKQFDYNIHQVSDIYSRASFFKGIDEISIVPGFFFKTGISFVFSEKQESINAIEVGAIIDLYTKPIQIMATEKKDQYFISLYVGYRFGKIKVKNRNPNQIIEKEDEETD